ncbi:MAG: GntR family transcriptional regulator [Rhizomicrobium sp.]
MDSIPSVPAIGDVVYQRILDAIVNGTLLPGAQITEQALAERLNVSKTPVREALLRLRQHGLIEASGKRGYRVVLLSTEALRATMEIREALEIYLAVCAAERANEKQKGQIMATAQASLTAAEAGDFDAFHVQDREFHSAIAGAVSNSAMDEQVARCIVLIHTAVRRDLPPDGEEIVRCGQRHVQVAKAIFAGDARAASIEMMGHLRSFHAVVIEQREASLAARGMAAE